MALKRLDGRRVALAKQALRQLDPSVPSIGSTTLQYRAKFGWLAIFTSGWAISAPRSRRYTGHGLPRKSLNAR